jgi:hypothetical protein
MGSSGAASSAANEHGTLIPLDKKDRTRWDEAEIAEGVRILQAALARDRRSEYQIQAAIAALHDDARTAGKPAGRRFSPGTTNSSSSPAIRSPRSAARSRSARSTAHSPG